MGQGRKDRRYITRTCFTGEPLSLPSPSPRRLNFDCLNDSCTLISRCTLLALIRVCPQTVSYPPCLPFHTQSREYNSFGSELYTQCLPKITPVEHELVTLYYSLC